MVVFSARVILLALLDNCLFFEARSVLKVVRKKHCKIFHNFFLGTAMLERMYFMVFLQEMGCQFLYLQYSIGKRFVTVPHSSTVFEVFSPKKII